MSWVRVMVANYLAAGGKQWSDTFSRQNGGTYNNQWSAARPLLQARPLLKGRAQGCLGRVTAGPLRAKTELTTLCDRFVVDAKLFTPGKPVPPNLLWVLEQIPGHITTGDQTDFLTSKGYWPSFNAPFYADIANMSGMVGDWE